MTKSTITRERLLEIIVTGPEASGAEQNELARMALAAMDSKPVAWTDEQELRDVDRGGCGYLFTVNPVTPHADERRIILLYRHAQLAPVVPPEQHWEELCRQHPDMSIGDAIIRAAWWNHCRAAMLQAGNSPTQSDCCPAQNSGSPEQNGVSPAQDGNSPATSDNWQVEAEKLAEMHGMSFVMFRHGEAPQCADPTKVVISFTDKGLGHDTLPAATQEVKGE
ncbi:TPA: hypothetical protein NPO49_000661 [Klebsiella quasipneumoniae subsp. quasipneumoniae]|nr:hypothetical protein [Klebsiella quasipneumoniae subsp. quasipneumoniae]